MDLRSSARLSPRSTIATSSLTSCVRIGPRCAAANNTRVSVGDGRSEMRILWVKANKLLPVDTGGKIRSLNLLRQLSARHEATLLSYYTGRRDPEYERDIVELLPGAMPVFTGIRDTTTLERAIQYVWRFPTSEPFAISKFGSRKVRRLVSRLIAERQFDVAVCDFIMPARNFPVKLETPSVLFEHNVEATLWRRRADAEQHPIK